MSGRSLRLTLFASVVAFLLAGACRRSSEARISAEEATLARRCQGLEALLAAAERGGGLLFDFQHVLVVVRQGLVEQVIDAALPFETTIAGKYQVKATQARVLFEDGFAVVELDGEASLLGNLDARAALTVYGGLDIVELDRESGFLRGRLSVYAVEAKEAQVMGVEAGVKELVEDIGKEKASEFAPLLSAVQIPVSLDQEIRLPALAGEGGVTIKGESTVLNAKVTDVKSFRHRLWITIELSEPGAPP